MRIAAALLAGGLFLAGCGGAETPAETDPRGEPSASRPTPSDDTDVALELVSDLAPDEAGAVGQAVNAFGFDLLATLTDGDENAVTSPLSVATMLAMVLAGAGGDTAAQMAHVLHLDDSRDVRVGALLDQLADSDDVTLSVANALWSDEGVPFEDDYLTFVRNVFGATVEEAELGDAETADEIDAWVDEHTEGLIEGIAEDLGLPDPAAVIVLINAVYFLGEWSTAFDPADTSAQPFTLPDGSRVDVPLMMLRDQELGYTQRDGYEMVRLPYGEQGRFGMEILLPDADSSLSEVLAALDAEEWRAATDGLADQRLGVVALPRFELDWQAELSDPLRQLGMVDAFTDADLRPMSPANPTLATVVHKTYIRVDEAGTQAAAVTGGVGRTSVGLSVRVDRPFAFTISDRQTGTVLFLGAVADPRS